MSTKDALIETGRIVNTHGVHGRLRLQPWADSPEVLTGIEYIYIDGKPVKVLSAEVHKRCVLVSLEGVDSIDEAIRLKNKVVSVRRSDITLDEGSYFVTDLIGLTAIDSETGGILGEINDIISLPAHSVYVVEGEREFLVPAVPEFIVETDIERGFIKLKLIEGL